MLAVNGTYIRRVKGEWTLPKSNYILRFSRSITGKIMSPVFSLVRDSVHSSSSNVTRQDSRCVNERPQPIPTEMTGGGGVVEISGLFVMQSSWPTPSALHTQARRS
jgi:hypothetical protein